MAFNYKQQVACQEIASALSSRLNRSVVASEVSAVPVVLVGTGVAGTQSASIRIQNQRGDQDMGWLDGINYGAQKIYTTGVAQILVENAQALPADVAASGTVTFLGTFVATDTVTVMGVTFTGTLTPTTNVQFLTYAGGDAVKTAQNFAAKVNAHPDVGALVTATTAGAVVTITSKYTGGVGNYITLAQGGGHATVSAGTLAGGTGAAGGFFTFSTVIATDALTVGGVTFTATPATQDATNFIVGGTDTITATNAATAINANTTTNKLVTAIGWRNLVLIIAKNVGAVGNLIGLSDADATITETAATLTGGAGGVLASTLSQADVNTIVCECGIRGLKVEFWAVAQGTAPVFGNIGSAVQFGEFDVLPYWPLSGRV